MRWPWSKEEPRVNVSDLHRQREIREVEYRERIEEQSEIVRPKVPELPARIWKWWSR